MPLDIPTELSMECDKIMLNFICKIEELRINLENNSGMEDTGLLKPMTSLMIIL